jgi:hypothetical protein
MVFLSDSSKQVEDSDRDKMFNINIVFEPIEIDQNSITKVNMPILDFSSKVENAS